MEGGAVVERVSCTVIWVNYEGVCLPKAEVVKLFGSVEHR